MPGGATQSTLNRCKAHWENIYSPKYPSQVSWYETTADFSLQLILKYAPEKKSEVADVGAGESVLVEHLLENDYKDITLIDISSKALEDTKKTTRN
ncbi:methyltransferase [Planobacterium sp. GCR5]|uniref:Methyltransferase n=1 Tax=Planobacterium oryzisoli TaxID=2771435 RepID=A0A931E926_9FLAO|nr:methyltransferase [Planobacterium oryzisoli]